MTPFMFATGIENSSPTILLPDGTRKRMDEMEKSHHYERWEEDLELVRSLDIDFLRYGPPYYKTHLGPGKYDWEFADQTFRKLRELRITPIVDLCHFGVPDWIGDFQNEDWPHHFAEYAREFAIRYDWVTLFTPINEIFIAATFSAQFGWWNECLQSDKAFVRALLNLCRANVMAMQAILSVRPDATFIQSESSEYFHAAHPSAIDRANFFNEKRFLSLDLTYGAPIDALMYEYLIDNGMTRKDYHWFLKNQVRSQCVMGNDYYITNEHLVYPDGRTSPSGEIFGYYVITHQYYRRYRLPVMHTETNIAEPDAVRWLWKEWANVHRLRQDGVPILGFTWFSLVDQVDWDTALREDNGRANSLGLFDLNRKIRPVGKAYKTLISQWKNIMPFEKSDGGNSSY